MSRTISSLSPKWQTLSLALGLSVFSNITMASDVSKVEPNDDLASAQALDGFFDRSASPDILHATFLPHVTVNATGNNTLDYYQFTVTDAGTKGIFDIDYGYLSQNYLRTHITIYNAAGEALATDSYGNISFGAKGSVSSYDAYIEYSFDDPGTYYIRVARPTDQAVTTGLSYQLNISLGAINLTTDSDGDGMPDSYETFYSFNPLVDDAAQDSDGDLFTNLEEYQQGSDPAVADTDLDGIPNASDDDDDGDGLTDAEEISLGTNPLLVDTDGDGSSDYSDAFPTLIDASLDSDGDGYADAWTNACDESCRQNSSLVLDMFPNSAAAYLDRDRDGLADEWFASCDAQCQSDSGLTLDPDAEFADSDGDGLSNAEDDDDNNDGVKDVDADSDGLIEISTLAQLNAMRFNLVGTSYKESSSAFGDSSGCPITLFGGSYQAVCLGYELTTDLNMDTNADGEMNALDDYWNDGAGWSAVGPYSGGEFRAVFEGNGFAISNLFINRPTSDYQGLFGRVRAGKIQNLKLDGPLSEVNCDDYCGLVAGYVYESNLQNVHVIGQVNAQDDYSGLLVAAAHDSHFTRVSANGQVTGDSYAGGLIGYAFGSINGASSSVELNASQYIGGLVGYLASNSVIENVFATGSVISRTNYAGGLIGRMNSDSSLDNGLAAVVLAGASNVGGLVGYGHSTVVSHSYWANDLYASSYGANESTSYIGLPLATLQCAVQSDTSSQNSDCVSEDGASEGLSAAMTLYQNWGGAGYKDANDVQQAFWHFGTSQQLPGLNFESVVYRDSDADGVEDSVDVWDEDRAVAFDVDNDGYPDRWNTVCDQDCVNQSTYVLDQFPSSAAGYLDADLDGLLDAWADSCDESCQIDSGLTLDDFLNDADNDGINDSLDTDDNNDGIADVDADSDGLIDVSTLAQLNSVRFMLNGSGYKADNETAIDQSGCPASVVNGQFQRICQGYELVNDLDFDTNADGVIDENDDYWNSGSGWAPLGSGSAQYFSSTFEGNGYAIKNVFINRPSNYYQGVFGYQVGGEIRNLTIMGDLTQVTCDDYCALVVGYSKNSLLNAVSANGTVFAQDNYAGLISGYAYDTVMKQVSVGGRVSGDSAIGGVSGLLKGEIDVAASHVVINATSIAGGLIGILDDEADVSNAYATGKVTTLFNIAGGLIGRTDANSNIANSYAVSVAQGSEKVGGLIGEANWNTAVSNSYWANDLTEISSRQNASTGYLGVDFETLQCAIQSDTTAQNSACLAGDSSVTLFKDWGAAGYTDESDVFHAYWHFGSSQQLPALMVNQRLVLDSDGDGVADHQDAWDENRAVSLDADNDGYPDAWNAVCDTDCVANSGFILDQFPSSNAGFADADLDGLLDAWADSCDEQCQLDSGLTLDAFPNDADNDGENDLLDTDDNNDGVVDVDADSDGLIEISSLAQLNAIRFSLDGAGYRSDENAALDQSGCPALLINGEYSRTCRGYELVNDLDFDTNADGKLNEQDDYWNGGSGWQPIGSTSKPFNSVLDGNGFSIRNLFIERKSGYYSSLIGYGLDVEVRNLALMGPHTHVTGFRYTGLLLGYGKGNINITNTVVSGSVESTYQYDGFAGGVAGYLSGKATLNGVFASVRVQGTSFIGGLVGYGDDHTEISNSFATGSVLATAANAGGIAGRLDANSSVINSIASVYGAGTDYVGGLVGDLQSSTVENSYWEIKLNPISDEANESTGYVGLSLNTLQCAVQANTNSDNSDCVSADGSAEGLTSALTLYKNWDSAGYTNDSDVFINYWQFGSAQQLPGLNLHGVTYRDSDGDGVLDQYDQWENNPAASVDDDQDGYPDQWSLGCDAQCIVDSGLMLDQFPQSNAGYLDADLDGRLDAWAESCNAQCQVDSGLVLDTHLNDQDNDGLLDSVDTDDNNDGVMDVDSDSDGLVDIYTLAQLNAMRYSLNGFGHKTASSALDSSGCPMTVHLGQYVRQCRGFELMNDLDFDTNLDGVIDSADDYWNNGVGWSPISNNSSFRFAAEFEGNGYTVKNLFIDRSTNYYQSLFGFLRHAEIRNLNMGGELTQLSCSSYCSLVASHAVDSKLSNLNVTGKINSTNDYVGLVLGSSLRASLSHIRAEGELSLDDYGGFVVGNAYVTELNEISVQGAIQGDQYIGGIAGYLREDSTLDVAFANVEISANRYVGGLVGVLVASSDIHNAMSVGSVTGTNNLGGLVGRLELDSSITRALSTANVSGDSNVGGLVGNVYSVAGTAVSQSYWANDVNEFGHSVNEEASFVGLPLTVLQCATQANSTFENSDCVSEDGAGENLNAAVTLYKDWDQSGYTDDSDTFHAYWTFGSDNQLPALTVSGQTYLDSDGDGVLDNTDADPFDHDNDGIVDAVDGFTMIAIGEFTDTDQDGIPDTCETQCITLGMTADVDDDNDGVLDEHDFYPLTSLDGRLDTDGDGIPNDCEPACPLPMLADTDDDNDGVPDEFDAFDLDPTESSDFDGDLIGDNADFDDDNDGVLDVDDSNLGQDDGLPLFGISELAEINIAVSTENGRHGMVEFTPDYFAALNASDVYDTEVDIRGTVNGGDVQLDESHAMQLPAGRHAVSWIAVDDAGNTSASIEQIVNVFPRVRFDVEESLVGEGSDAKVVVRLTGNSPQYPVVVNLQMNVTSDTDQDDFAPQFDTALVHQVTIEQGSQDTLNLETTLVIPVAQDNESENDEVMFIDLQGVPEQEGEEHFFMVDELHQQHRMTVTEQNLVPEVTLLLKQNDVEVANVVKEGGLVTVTASISDPNGSDTHTTQWDLGRLPLNAPVGRELVFDPIDMATGRYAIQLAATDDGINPLTGVANMNLNIVSTDTAPTVQLTLLQSGRAVVNIQKDGGLVTIQASIVDNEGATGHKLSWDLSSIGMDAADGARLEFDPANIESGVYEISVTVTDGNDQTDTKTLSLAVVSAGDGRTVGGSDDSGSSGGGSLAWYLLLMFGVLLGRYKQMRH